MKTPMARPAAKSRRAFSARRTSRQMRNGLIQSQTRRAMRLKPETGDAVSTERLLSTDIVDSFCVESIIHCKYAAGTGEDYSARLSGVNDDILRPEPAGKSSLLSEPNW